MYVFSFYPTLSYLTFSSCTWRFISRRCDQGPVEGFFLLGGGRILVLAYDLIHEHEAERLCVNSKQYLSLIFLQALRSVEDTSSSPVWSLHLREHPGIALFL